VKSIEARLEGFLERIPESGCWLFSGYTNRQGYGVLGNVNGRNQLAHRVAYELHAGGIPEGMLVCHRCDVPSCANPAHLFLGTSADNAVDSAKKGRKKNKLTAAQVRRIETARSAGGSKYDGLALAAEFGVCPDTIYAYANGRRYLSEEGR